MPPYNSQKFDPGRMIYQISFYNQVTTDNGSGGTTVSLDLSLSTRAAKETTLRQSQAIQLGVFAGESRLDEAAYFVIRNRKNWYPAKDMTVKVDNQNYTILTIFPVNDPPTYLKLICIKSD